MLISFLLCSCKHIRKVPYTESELVNETLSHADGLGEWNRIDGFPGFSMPRLKASAFVTNTSTHDGTFSVLFHFSSQGDEFSFEGQEFIRAGERKRISAVHDINHFTFQTNVQLTIEVVAPTIQVEKIVTKYRDEEYYSLGL